MKWNFCFLVGEVGNLLNNYYHPLTYLLGITILNLQMGDKVTEMLSRTCPCSHNQHQASGRSGFKTAGERRLAFDPTVTLNEKACGRRRD